MYSERLTLCEMASRPEGRVAWAGTVLALLQALGFIISLYLLVTSYTGAEDDPYAHICVESILCLMFRYGPRLHDTGHTDTALAAQTVYSLVAVTVNCVLVCGALAGSPGAGICPETFDVFKTAFEKVISSKFAKHFDVWICVARELAFSNHFFTKLPPLGIPYDSSLVSKIYNELMGKKSYDLVTKQLEQIHQKMIGLMERIEGNAIMKPEHIKDLKAIFFRIEFKEDNFRDQLYCPIVKSIHYKTLDGPVEESEKMEVFFNKVKASRKEEILFVGIDDQALCGLLQSAFWNHEVFERKTLGLVSLKEVISHREKTLRGDVMDYLSQYGKLDDENILNTMEDAFRALKFTVDDPKFDSVLLHSPRVNSILVNSSIPMFSDKFVTIKIRNTIWRTGKNICDGRVLKTFWNCDSSQEIKLRINAFMNPYKEALVVPSQCSVIPKGKKIKIVVVNKSSQRMDSFGINRDQDDCIFGMADIVSKKKVSDVVGFESLREAFYQRWPKDQERNLFFKKCCPALKD